MAMLGVHRLSLGRRCSFAPFRAFSVVSGKSPAPPVLENPLLKQGGLPQFQLISAPDVKPAVQELLSNLDADLLRLESVLADSESPQYADVVEELEKMEAPIEYAWGVVGHLMGVNNSDDLRAAHQEMQGDVVKVVTKISQSAEVYKAVNAVPQDSLDEAQKRIVSSSIQTMKLSGVGLEGDAKEKFNANQIRLSELGTQFMNHVIDATKAFELIVTDKADMEGMPPSAMALAAQMAVASGQEAATPEDGPWKLGLDMPSFLPAMQHLKSSSIREKLYRAFVTRAGEANEPIITEILKLRKEQAQILGFSSHAEVSVERKMAESVAAVDALTEDLRSKALPAAIKELDRLTAFAKAKGFQGDKLELWDTTFWGERQKEELFGFEEEELRPYFALPNVLAGLFGLCKRLFGVDIVAADGEASVWHDDVRFFKVMDEETGEHIASFYLDPYSRPATKRGGAWMDTCLGRSQVLCRKPVAYLTCNGSPPVGDKPSLMTFNEVTTLFHETGHGLQHMLTKVPHAPAAGIQGVEWDAVELPSQFMENWCYDEKTVYDAGLAVHYETGEPLPKELFAKLKELQKYNAGMMMLRQLSHGKVDMELHHNYDPSGDRTPFDVQKEIADSGFALMPPLPEDRFLCSFNHIFAGGYSAGYYSYKWAEVLSADAFAAFEEVGLDNEEAVRETGRRFRDTVLSMGGGKHPSEVYRAFRGKDPSPEALLRHSGLA